jgi:hypothetical protein
VSFWDRVREGERQWERETGRLKEEGLGSISGFSESQISIYGNFRF